MDFLESAISLLKKVRLGFYVINLVSGFAISCACSGPHLRVCARVTVQPYLKL